MSTKTNSSPAAAAIHIDRVRGHELASVGAEKQHQFADFLRFAEALHRDVIQKTLDQFGRGLRSALERGLDWPGGALQGFSPTPEFPEIAEAQTLLEALS
jgi:hypothetical protein